MAEPLDHAAPHGNFRTETAEFSVALSGGEGVDLGNMLTTLSGVIGVRLGTSGQSVQVNYDPAFTDRDVLAAAIVGSGYPIAGSDSESKTASSTHQGGRGG
ncbi:MAG: hypothetical protein ACRDFS_10095 [Chloroflexota bacterium]